MMVLFTKMILNRCKYVVIALCHFCFNPTHINVVEDGDIEGEPLPPLDRVGQSQLCKEVLADQQGSWLGHSEANLDEEKINVYCLLDSVHRDLVFPPQC